MHLSRSGLGKLVFGAALLALAGCASQAEPEYATKSDIQALRTEIRASQSAAQAAQEQAAASAAAAQQAAAEAQAAAEKADAIFRQSLRK